VRKSVRAALTIGVVIVGLVTVLAWSGGPLRAQSSRSASLRGASGRPGQRADLTAGAGATYATLATRSARLLEYAYYNGTGLWHMCVPVICNTKNRDWGADALTNLLWFRLALQRDQSVLPLLRALAGTAHLWVRSDTGSSDSVTWDAVADVRLYQATGNRIALRKAEAALTWINTTPGLAAGACPAIAYQWPDGQRGYLKTIETTTNYIKAALLLDKITGRRHYLIAAERQYAQVRHYFLAKRSGLYSSYMFDVGGRCQVLHGSYFASVNGNMIWAGSALAAATGKRGYLSEAVSTARAVATRLSDGAGIFADLQADNDIVVPLVEAMYRLATTDHQRFAVRWLLANASAAGADDNAAGEFGRFFDGPPPSALATSWQISGGIALVTAAAALRPGWRPADPGYWHGAQWVPDEQTLHKTPARIAFTGRAIAIMGTIGAKCCLYGHARVFIDGVQTVNRTGIWQDMSSPARRQPDQVLFAWRWRRAGRHVITIEPGLFDREEGGSFFQMTGYLLVP
jgi:hypothetical protein